MDIRETRLPGADCATNSTTPDGDRIGVIAQRGGEFEVFVYAGADPDRGRRVFRLTGNRRPRRSPRSWVRRVLL